VVDASAERVDRAPSGGGAFVSTTPKLDTGESRRARSVTAPMVAAAVVTAIFAARLVAAFLVNTPRYFPDEYFYTALSRSLWSGSFPSIRGGHVGFMSLLAPLVFAPAWLVDNVHVAYRIAQTEGVLVVALAAVPAYLLAARIGLGDRERVAAAVFAVVIPDAVYGGYMLSEPFAYPLFLTVVLLAVEALAAPTARKQAVFLVVCGLLVFARTQFAVLPIAYLCAGWACYGHLSPRRVVREQWLVVATAAIVGGLLAAIGFHRSLGMYAGLTSFELTPGATLHWFAANAALLAIASGWVIVPGAVLGILSMSRSRDARQRAFGLLVVPLLGVLLLEAAIFGVGIEQLMERYSFYAAPLLALAFLAGMRDGLLERRAHRWLLAAFAGLALMLPVDHLLLFARDDFAPTLVALRPARDALGDAFPLAVVAPLVVATVAALIFARYGRPFAVALIGLAICGGASAGASVVLADPGQGSAHQIAVSGPATFVKSRWTDDSKLMSTLFWNAAIQRVLVVPGYGDNVAATAAEIGPGGVIRTNGRRVRGALVFDADSAVVRLRGARVHSQAGLLVVSGAGNPTVAFLADGWFERSGYLGSSGRFVVTAPAPDARLHTRLILRLQTDRHRPKAVLWFASSSGLDRRITIGDRPTVVSLPVVGRGVWSCKFALVGGQSSVVDGKMVSVRALSIALRPPLRHAASRVVSK
jgi:hypothetical protein